MKRTMVMVALLGLGIGPFAVQAARADTGQKGATSATSAPGSTTPPVGIESEEMIRAPFTVQQVDKTNRRLTVESPDGERSTVAISPDMQGFDGLKPGDQIALDYYKAAVLEMEPATHSGAANHARQPQAMSAGSATQGASHRVTSTGKILSVDPQQGTLRVAGVDGQPQTLAVQDPALKRQLRSLKSGEQVTVTYTEPVAVGLHPTGANK